jgi:hypothetical protein
MRRTSVAVAVVLSLAGVTYAQQSGNSRRPNQIQDTGVDDNQTPPGQARKGPADRVVLQAPVGVTLDGVAVAELDETFDEALVITINPDGSRTYIEVKGTKAAEAVVKSPPKPAPVVQPLEEK